jgi:hypothetical protein
MNVAMFERKAPAARKLFYFHMKNDNVSVRKIKLLMQ